LGAAIPVVQNIVNDIKKAIDKKTQDPTQAHCDKRCDTGGKGWGR
jgi:hypothetical protein